MSFQSTSPEFPALLHVSFANHDPNATLGAQLVNCDSTAVPKEGETLDKYMFTPGYAIVGKLIGGSETVAKKSGVMVGDIIIAVNGLGFRRFAQDYTDDEITVIKDGMMSKKGESDDGDSTEGDSAAEGDLSSNGGVEGVNGENGDHSKSDDKDVAEEMTVMNHRVVPGGNAYNELLSKIKSIKAAKGDPPLILTMERYGWDARPNSWNRFLKARDYNVPAAMEMLQQHEQWKRRMFPIDLVTYGMQKLLREKVISEIDVETENSSGVYYPRTVYVDYGKLLSLQTTTDIQMDDIVQCFIIFTERQLAHKSNDPRSPKTCQFIDLSGVSITTTGFRVDTLKQIYNTFEPNYPETLDKMVIFPLSTLMGTTARTLLSFMNEKTRKKIIIASTLEQACSPLGWDPAEVEECGGLTEFMHKHEKAGRYFYHD